jgi:hypothetical protein
VPCRARLTRRPCAFHRRRADWRPPRVLVTRGAGSGLGVLFSQMGPSVPRRLGRRTLPPRSSRSAARVLLSEGWRHFTAGFGGGHKFAVKPPKTAARKNGCGHKHSHSLVNKNRCNLPKREIRHCCDMGSQDWLGSAGTLESARDKARSGCWIQGADHRATHTTRREKQVPAISGAFTQCHAYLPN